VPELPDVERTRALAACLAQAESTLGIGGRAQRNSNFCQPNATVILTHTVGWGWAFFAILVVGQFTPRLLSIPGHS
jgi:hypothetical protein